MTLGLLKTFEISIMLVVDATCTVFKRARGGKADEKKRASTKYVPKDNNFFDPARRALML